MATENDGKIKVLLASIEKKKEEMGVKPKGNWKSNGVLPGNVNINTLNSLDKCVGIASSLLMERQFLYDACGYLEVDKDQTRSLSKTDDYLDDLKLKVKIIKWDAEKKKLSAMEKKLKDLRSEDAKTSDELADITKDLGL